MKHLDQKYFSFRARKVDAAVTRYPDRAAVLVTSEYLRLGFVAIGSLLCAGIFGILTVTAVPRIGWLEWRTITFGLLTVFPAAIVFRVVSSVVNRLRNRSVSTASY